MTPGNVLIPPVDVLVITALKLELDELLKTEPGNKPWVECSVQKYDFPVWFNEITTLSGVALRVAAARCLKMGPTSAANLAGQLVALLNPTVVTMCGVCAGRPGKTKLGDVIIAKMVEDYEEGALVKDTATGIVQKQPAPFPSRVNHKWWYNIDEYKPDLTKDWVKTKPYTTEEQGYWVLDKIANERDPMEPEQQKQFCPDWAKVIQSLWKSGYLVQDDLTMTETGQQFYRGQRIIRVGKSDTKEPIRVMGGNICTGSAVMRDPDYFKSLYENLDREILGIEMEAASIGLSAWVSNKDFLVVKGVMDHGDNNKADDFKAFTARASAEVLLDFLVKYWFQPAVGQPQNITGLQTQTKPSHPQDRVLSPCTFEKLPTINPANLLNARYGVVPFVGAHKELRKSELAEIETWLEAEDTTSVALFHGPGGTGKTRLFIEVAKQFKNAGWSTGFLDNELTEEAISGLLSADRNTIAIIDYAESRTNLPQVLKRMANRFPDEQYKLRIVLLSRNAADWWSALKGDNAIVRNVLEGALVRVVSPVPVDTSIRQEIFQEAGEAYAKVLKKTTKQVFDLSNPIYERPLYIHMAALASIEGLVFRSETLLQGIVEHEIRSWGRLYDEMHPGNVDQFEKEQFIEQVKLLMAAVTLRGGVKDISALSSLSKDISLPGNVSIQKMLHRLYAGKQTVSGETDKKQLDKTCYATSLEPDILGEELVRQVLTTTPTDYLINVFAHVDAEEIKHGFIVLGRLSLLDCTTVSKWVETLILYDVESRALPAFQAALALGAETAFAGVGDFLAEILAKQGSIDLIFSLYTDMESTVSLQKLAMVVSTRLLKYTPVNITDEETLHYWASLLTQHSLNTANVGLRKEALKTLEQAVGMYRQLVEYNKSTYLPDLASCLTILRNRYADIGNLEESLETIEEAVKILRILASKNPKKYLPNLVGCLNNLNLSYADLNRKEEALKTIVEATGILRQLINNNSDVYMPVLAQTLNNLSLSYVAMGNSENALLAVEEAATIYRQLSLHKPDSYLPKFAITLNNLSNSFAALRNKTNAFDAISEAVCISRKLAEQRPDVYLKDFAMCLNTMSNCLSDLGRWEEALQASEEATRFERKLAKLFPDACLPGLAKSLNNLCLIYIALERKEDAFKAIEEAVSIYSTYMHREQYAYFEDFIRAWGNMYRIIQTDKLTMATNKVWQDALKLVQELYEKGILVMPRV